MTDEELMRRYRSGDATAFDALYARHRGPLFRYLARLLGDASDPEAVFQETWLKIVRHRDRWSAEQPLRPWIYRIARNAAIDAMRAGGRLSFDDERDVNALPADQPGVERWQFIRDCIERLQGILAALPAAQRDAFLLKEEAGLTLEQIAAIGQVGRETVKSRLRYALARLRRGLEGCEDV